MPTLDDCDAEVCVVAPTLAFESDAVETEHEADDAVVLAFESDAVETGRAFVVTTARSLVRRGTAAGLGGAANVLLMYVSEGARARRECRGPAEELCSRSSAARSRSPTCRCRTVPSKINVRLRSASLKSSGKPTRLPSSTFMASYSSSRILTSCSARIISSISSERSEVAA